MLAADSDSGDDVTGYAITGGADQTFFSIGATSGALTFDDAPNFEDAKDTDTGNDYVVEVQATSGTGERVKTATQTITVTVADVGGGEKPSAPAAPMVSAASVTSLNVTWAAPDNAGPAVTGLRRAVPDKVAGGRLDGGGRHDEHGAVGDALRPRRGHGVRRAGARCQRRWRERLVGVGQRGDGRQPGGRDGVGDGADRDRTGRDRGQLHGGPRHRADARCHGDGRRARM